MDKSFEVLINGGKYPEIWQAIAENRIELAKKEISKHSGPPKKSVLSIFKKKTFVRNAIVLQVASSILATSPDKKLPKIALSIRKEETRELAELTRLLVALQRNGHFAADADALSKKILEQLADLAEQVSVQAGDYPNNTIEGIVLAAGYETYELCVPLAGYFEHLNDLNSKACVLQIRSKISCSIMSHYPYTVGPDMIETATALETIGETELSNKYYSAVIADFERIADEIKRHPEEEVWEEQIISLTSLKQAYENSNRLNNTMLYSEQLQFLNAVIEKGATRVQDANDMNK